MGDRTGTGAGPGRGYFGTRREESEIGLGMRGFGIVVSKEWQREARQGREKSDRSWQKKVGGEKGRV